MSAWQLEKETSIDSLMSVQIDSLARQQRIAAIAAQDEEGGDILTSL
jgi:hypothetical protein